MKTAIACLLGGLVLCGCPKKDLDPLLDGGLTVSEQDAADRNGRGANSIQGLAEVADSVFNFDPTIDPAKNEAANATAIQMQATTNLNGCGSAMLSGTTVTVDFGAGCTLKNGVIASGSLSVAVAKSGSMITMTLVATMVQIDGQSIDGTMTWFTSNGTSFTAEGTVTTKDGTFTINLTFSGTPTSIGIAGTLQEMNAAVKSFFTFSSVVWKHGDCYPNSGSVNVERGDLMSLITFDANTPATGKVAITAGKHTVTQTLPPYGMCPPM